CVTNGGTMKNRSNRIRIGMAKIKATGLTSGDA
ncbi:hypothetical protein MIMGU_mgv1a0137731mg, partial [Erythranthe guttata]